MPVLTYDIDRDRRDIDVSRDIVRLRANATPFAVIMMRARKQVTRTSELYWYDEEPYEYWTQINNAAGYDASATTFKVDANIYEPKDLLKCPRTGEVFFVTAVDVDNKTITVVRGYGGTTAAALVDDDWIVNLGNAMEERSKAPTEKIRQPDKNYNYTQIFRTPFGESGTSAAEQKKTNENERTRLRRSKSIDHRMALERALLFGTRSRDATGKRSTTGGLLQFIQTNVMDIGGTLTESAFEDACEVAFSEGSENKLLVASPRVITVINRFAAGKLVTESGQRTYGVRMRRYESGHGALRIVPSRTLEKQYAGYGIFVDMDYVLYRPLTGRDTKLRANIHDPDLDGWLDEYMTEAGLQVRLEKAHAVMKGVTN